MRIITGTFKGTKLFGVEGETARPTKDFVKELLFSVLFDCEGLQVLDLYAGSGSLGFEALSRGADFVDFVDFSDKAIAAMIKNEEKLKCGDAVKIYKRKATTFIETATKKWDLIFLDPPYNKNLVSKTLEAIFKKNIAQGRIVIEHSPLEKIPAEFTPYLTYEKISGITKISILKKEET